MRAVKIKLIFVCLIMFATFSRAINSDSTKHFYIEEVVVQSFKLNSMLSSQPIAGSVINQIDLRERNVESIKNLSALVPNLFMPDYGSKMTSPVYIRGIGSRTNTPSVGLYVDGVPYFDRSAFDFDINDVDRIEILRGSQGTIYGRNTMGGIINVYTKSPFKNPGTNLNMGAGNYGNYQLAASHSGSANGNFGYSLSGNYRSLGGYFDNITRGNKADAMDALSGRLRLSWQAAPSLVIHLSSVYEYSDQDGYPYALYDNASNTVGPIDYDAKSFFCRNVSTTGLNVEYLTSGYRIASQSSLQYIDAHQGLDQDFSPKDVYYVDYLEDQKMFSQEFNIKSNSLSSYQSQSGVFGFYQSYNYNSDVNTRDPAIASATFRNKILDVKNPTRGLAIYHQSTFKDLLVEDFSVSLGMRYDYEKADAKTSTSQIAVDQSVMQTYAEGDDAFSQITPKISMQYNLNAYKMFYASIAKGYKSGGFNPSAQQESDYSYDPEYSWTYELGSKGSYLSGLLEAEANLFYITWRQQQISQSQPDGKGYILKNAGKSESKGAELSLRLNPNDRLGFHINYGITLATFKKYENDVTNINYKGNYLPMVPKNTFSAAADYNIIIKNFFVENIKLNAQYTGLGRLYWREDNIASQPFYGLVDARMSLQRKNISLDLWAKNITGKKYIAYYFVTSKPYAQAGRPMTCGINLNLKF